MQKEVDLVVHNAVIYTLDGSFSTVQAMAIDGDTIVALGAEQEIRNNFSSKRRLDAGGKAIYPGFIDSHCHFVFYGLSKLELDLTGTKSWAECLEVIQSHAKSAPGEWILGRGWDQNDWAVKEFPTNKELTELFPDRPVYISRVDGHAAIANAEALKRAGLTRPQKVKGGEMVEIDGKLTGLLIDRAMEKVDEVIADPNEKELRQAILRAQEDCFAVGLTTVDDAGLDPHVIELIEQMQDEGALKMRVYAMLNPTDEGMEYMSKNMRVSKERLTVRSVKLYGDGALGSRGAALKNHYHDDPGNKGEMLYDRKYYSSWAGKAGVHGYQINTHCIGDRANQILLDVYQEHLGGTNDKRWRIEHAQVVTGIDMAKFGRFNILPSIQPTHATSDMAWAEDRLGAERIEGAYAYRSLLEQNGQVLLGTDFPVEGIDPLETFYAAVFRKDDAGTPEGGWRTDQGLSRKEALMGMTIWGAIGNFEEKVKGSFEEGKVADFVILDRDIMRVSESSIKKAKVEQTFIAGERVY